MASTFPDSMDNIVEFLDVTQSDATLLTQYQTAIQNGDFTLAATYLQQISNYAQKIVNATRLNQIGDAVEAIETYYKSNIQSYITTKQAEWLSVATNFVYKGTYSDITQYTKDNMVFYTNNGIDYIYICIATPSTVGILPTNSTYWQQLTIQGLKGTANTTTTSYAGVWDSATAYIANQIVEYNNQLWLCTTANSNQAPTSSSTYWSNIMSLTQQIIYPMQTTQPTGQIVGEWWYQIIT